MSYFSTLKSLFYYFFVFCSTNILFQNIITNSKCNTNNNIFITISIAISISISNSNTNINIKIIIVIDY